MTTRRTNGVSPSPGTSSTPQRTHISTSSISTAQTLSTTVLRSSFLPTPLETLLLSIFPLTLILGSLFSHLSPSLAPPLNTSTYSSTHQAFHPPEAAPSYFATKRNVFNVYFVKIGWFWVTLALGAFTLLAARGRACVNSGIAHFLLGSSNEASDEHELEDENSAESSQPAAPTIVTTSPRLSSLDPTTRRTERDARLRRQYQVLLRYLLCTLLWFLTTQWFFGPPLSDRGFSLTGGVCQISSPRSSSGIIEVEAHVPDVFSQHACRAAGGKWRGGWDVSGHVFLLVLGSGMLWMEMLPIMVPWIEGVAGGRVIRTAAPEGSLGIERRVTVAESDEAPLIHHVSSSIPESPRKQTRSTKALDEANPLHLRRAYATALALGIALLSWWMLLMTAAFFHTWSEKLGGLLIAAAGLWGVYFGPRGWRSFRGLVGMPGV